MTRWSDLVEFRVWNAAAAIDSMEDANTTPLLVKSAGNESKGEVEIIVVVVVAAESAPPASSSDSVSSETTTAGVESVLAAAGAVGGDVAVDVGADDGVEVEAVVAANAAPSFFSEGVGTNLAAAAADEVDPEPKLSSAAIFSSVDCFFTIGAVGLDVGPELPDGPAAPTATPGVTLHVGQFRCVCTMDALLAVNTDAVDFGAGWG